MKKKSISLVLAIIMIATLGVTALAYTDKVAEIVSIGQLSTMSISYHDAFAVKTDGTLWAWGDNWMGGLGDGSPVDNTTNSFPGFIEHPEPFLVMSEVVSVASAQYQTFAIKADGTLWSWGYGGHSGSGEDDDYSLLGDDRVDNVQWINGQGYTYYFRTTPKQIMTDVAAICADDEDPTIFALKKDGTLWAWGKNKNYEFGDGTTVNRNVPVKVMSDVVAFRHDENWTFGNFITYAVKSDGTLWSWGSSAKDYFKSPTIKTPTQVVGGTREIFEKMYIIPDYTKGDNYDWMAGYDTSEYVAITYSGTGDSGGPRYLAIKKDGTLWQKVYYGDFVQVLSNVRLPVSVGTTVTVSATELGNKILWTPETQDAGYWIYRSTEKGNHGERINEKPVKGGSFVDINVDSNTTYYYTIVKDGDTPDKTTFNIVEVKTGKILGADAEGKKNFILMQMGKDTMNVNGEVIEIDPGRGTAPIGLNGRTLVPIGAIINVMGGTAEWNGTEQKISISASGHDIAMWVGRKDILVDSATKQMDVEPQFTNGRTLLPLKFVAENLDSLATWVGSTQEIIMVFYT